MIMGDKVIDREEMLTFLARFNPDDLADARLSPDGRAEVVLKQDLLPAGTYTPDALAALVDYLPGWITRIKTVARAYKWCTDADLDEEQTKRLLRVLGAEIEREEAEEAVRKLGSLFGKGLFG